MHSEWMVTFSYVIFCLYILRKSWKHHLKKNVKVSHYQIAISRPTVSWAEHMKGRPILLLSLLQVPMYCLIDKESFPVVRL